MDFEIKIKRRRKIGKSQEEIDKEIVIQIFQEKTIPEIARNTGYSEGYIKRRLNSLYKIYGVKSKVGLVIEILKMSLITTTKF